MKVKLAPVQGAVVAPLGFKAGGVFCDIKRLGTGKGSDKGPKRDLALLVSDQPCAVAGLFTTNQVCAAPVKVCIPRAAKGVAQAVVINSGNANACTGRQGMKDALRMADLAEDVLGVRRGQPSWPRRAESGCTCPCRRWSPASSPAPPSWDATPPMPTVRRRPS